MVKATGNGWDRDADRRITQRFKEALGLIEVRTIDHIVVGMTAVCRFQSKGICRLSQGSRYKLVLPFMGSTGIF